MSHAIPRIQYNINSFTGDIVSGSNTILNVTPTTGLVAGRTISGAGIPLETVIDTIVGSTITLTKEATATTNGLALEGSTDINFDYPPKEPDGEAQTPKEREAVSVNGTVQLSTDYIEATRDMKFSFLSPAIEVQMKAFYTTWGYWGKEFRYYDDKTTTSYVVWELNSRKYEPTKIAPRGVGYVWEVPVKMRRVVA